MPLRSAARLALITALAASLTGAAVAQSQPLRPPEGMEEALRPDFMRRDLELFAQILQLDEAQRDIVAGLFSDYEGRAQAGVTVLREAMSGARRGGLGAEGGDVRGQEEFRAQMSKLLEEMRGRREEAARTGDAEAVKAVQAEMRRRIEEIRAEYLPAAAPQDQGQMQKMMDDLQGHIDGWRTQKAALTADFVESVKAVLTPEQLERWPVLERQLTRQNALPRGRLSGESLDLVTLVRRLDLEPADLDGLRPVLEEYERALHAALVARDAQVDRGPAQAAGGVSVSDAESAARRQVDLRVAVRDVNDRYARTIAARLRPPAGVEFDREVALNGYSRVYRPTSTEQAFRQARQLEGLDEGVRVTIEALEDGFRLDLESRNARLAEVLRRVEPEEARQRLVRQWVPDMRDGDIGRGDGGEELRLAFQERTALGQRYLELLADMLTPDQKVELSRYLPSRAPERMNPEEAEREAARRAVERGGGLGTGGGGGGRGG